jgi:hypothetical protein
VRFAVANAGPEAVTAADDAIEPGQREAYRAMDGNPPTGVAKVAVMVRGLPPAFDLPLGE